MKRLFILVLLLTPAICFSLNCIDVTKNTLYSINSDRDEPLIISAPDCAINFLSIDIYNRWGENIFAEKIYSNAEVSTLNEKISQLKTNTKIAEGTYYFSIKYNKQPITEPI